LTIIERRDIVGMKLFESIQVGALRLPNRIVMAPMTRNRAGHRA
jgi:2,4-dienoyl-CoA reductase-like NADH-dependent reductase (Old Yellow Enzyme family)